MGRDFGWLAVNDKEEVAEVSSFAFLCRGSQPDHNGLVVFLVLFVGVGELVGEHCGAEISGNGS